MVITTDTVKAFGKTQHHSWLKKKKPLYPQQSWYRGNIPQHDKSIYYKTKANIILNGEKLKVFPLKSGKRQGWLFSQFLFNIELETLARVIRQEKEINWHPN